MDLIERTNAFIRLGKRLQTIPDELLDDVVDRASSKNPWFIRNNIHLAFEGLIHYLDERKILSWLEKYKLGTISPKNVGTVMAGNIPMVGIHDMICVLISGHRLVAKLSKQDDVLIPFIANELTKIEPEFEHYIAFVEQLKDIDAVIATGSDNSARYFEYYFSKFPHIIRKNRTSVAILGGDENPSELNELAHDLFSYFGLGCRNVSKLFLPRRMDIKELLPHFEQYKNLTDHSKYSNNYYYNKTIYLVNLAEHLDSGFALFVQHEKLVSPISVIYYDYYDDLDVLKGRLRTMKDKIQCVISNIDVIENHVSFGMAQMPEIWDYADNIDTMEFLSKIST